MIGVIIPLIIIVHDRVVDVRRGKVTFILTLVASFGTVCRHVIERGDLTLFTYICRTISQIMIGGKFLTGAIVQGTLSQDVARKVNGATRVFIFRTVYLGMSFVTTGEALDGDIGSGSDSRLSGWFEGSWHGRGS